MKIDAVADRCQDILTALSQVIVGKTEVLEVRFPGAEVNSIEKEVEDGKVVYDIELKQKGRKVVARHYRMLDELLKACDKSVAVSRYVSRDEER